jgi:hypothetical protein
MTLHASFVIPCVDKSGHVIGRMSRDIRNIEVIPSIGSSVIIHKELKLKVIDVEYAGNFPSVSFIWIYLEHLELTGELKAKLNNSVKSPYNWSWTLDA